MKSVEVDRQAIAVITAVADLQKRAGYAEDDPVAKAAGEALQLPERVSARRAVRFLTELAGASAGHAAVLAEWCARAEGVDVSVVLSRLATRVEAYYAREDGDENPG